MAPNVLIFLCWFSSLSSLAHELGLLPGEWYHIQLSSASSQHRDLYLIEMYTLEVYKIMSSGTQKGFTIAMMHAWHSHHLNRVPLYLSGDTCGLSVIVPIMLCINLQRFFFFHLMAVSCSFSLPCFHPECFFSDQGQPAWFRCIHEHDNILPVMGASPCLFLPNLVLP